jgi:hypothetical protein
MHTTSLFWIRRIKKEHGDSRSASLMPQRRCPVKNPTTGLIDPTGNMRSFKRGTLAGGIILCKGSKPFLESLYNSVTGHLAILGSAHAIGHTEDTVIGQAEYGIFII